MHNAKSVSINIRNGEVRMDRKEFLRCLGGCCAAVASLQVVEAETAPAAGSPSAGTPINDRMAFAQRWAKRMLDNMDKELDEATRTRLLHANGRTCFDGSEGKPPQSGIDAFVANVTKWSGGPEHSPIRRDGDVVYFDYVGNPKTGLKVADGWCLCPLVEKGPEGLSGSYCECSVGYVTAMFSQVTGQPVRVELLESLKRGGKGCRFKIYLT
jgi:hypothetical protein